MLERSAGMFAEQGHIGIADVSRNYKHATV